MVAYPEQFTILQKETCDVLALKFLLIILSLWIAACGLMIYLSGSKLEDRDLPENRDRHKLWSRRIGWALLAIGGAIALLICFFGSTDSTLKAIHLDFCWGFIGLAAGALVSAHRKHRTLHQILGIFTLVFLGVATVLGSILILRR